MRKRYVRDFAPLLASFAALGCAAILGACSGSVEPAPGEPATTGSSGSAGNSGASGTGSGGGAAGPDGGGASTGPGGTVPDAPGELSTPYARLTRDEYQATIKAAFNIADAPVTGVPADNRIGPYTSNVGSPDPVMEYLLASEDLAAQIVPGKLPACTKANAAQCVTASYQAPLERLYRRALDATEVTALTTMFTSLVGAGVTPENATRGMVVSALISSDFLFRSMAVPGDPARGRRLAEHVGYALWDAPPDADLVAAGKASASDLGAKLKEQALRLSTDARAIPVLARFMGQWLRIDIDNRLDDSTANFATSPVYAELLAFVKNALATNVPVKSFVNGTQGFIQKSNFKAYGMTAATTSGDVATVTWPANRRGVIGEELFLSETRHPDASRRPIYRGHLVRSSLLCETIPPPPINAVDMNSEIADRTLDSRCAGCHGLMDPIGKAFAPLDLDNTIGSPAPLVNGAGEVKGTFKDLPTLLDAIADSQTFADCFSRQLLGFLLEQDQEYVDDAAIADVSPIVKSGGSLADVVGQAVLSLEKRNRTAIPWCSGQ